MDLKPVIIESNSPVNALKKFQRLHCMSTGIYEFQKSNIFNGVAYMITSFGSEIMARKIKE